MDYSAFHWSEKARKYAETLGTIFNVKGRVNTVADLPATGNKIGDVYLVGLTTDTDLSEYAWLSFDNVTRWEKLGSTATSLAFSAITGSPNDNTALKNALDSKQDELPSQTGNNGKFLTTNGSTISWATVDALPSQTSQSGKFLTTNGTSASWGTIPSDSTKANTSLDNLTSTGKNIGNWSSNVSNCITEIPQDIKLELNNGTLTLKAGSKVYVPNGSGVFDVVTISDDLTTTAAVNAKWVVFAKNNELQLRGISNCTSGTSQPSGNYLAFYNTSTNSISLSGGDGSFVSGYSFPIAVITSSGGAITSINQIFNGFGYIGSTVFALPGVKCLRPNGRNDDGTLKNTTQNISSVITKTFSDSENQNNVDCVLQDTTFLARNQIVVKSASEIGTSTGNYYILDENRFVYSSSGSLSNQKRVIIGKITVSSGKVTFFTSNAVFRAVDYSDKGTVAGWSMPSNKHIDLTLGASGATYTAPANGWFYFAKIANASNQYMTMYVNNSDPSIFATTITQPIDGGQARLFLPVKKGDVVGVSYNLAGETRRFCFVYAEGEV